MIKTCPTDKEMPLFYMTVTSHEELQINFHHKITKSNTSRKRLPLTATRLVRNISARRHSIESANAIISTATHKLYGSSPRRVATVAKVVNWPMEAPLGLRSTTIQDGWSRLWRPPALRRHVTVRRPESRKVGGPPTTMIAARLVICNRRLYIPKSSQLRMKLRSDSQQGGLNERGLSDFKRTLQETNIDPDYMHEVTC